MTCPTPAPRLSSGLYRAAFDEHPQPMWIYDADDLSVIAANDAAVRQYGHSAELLGELRVHELHPASDAERAVAYYLDRVLTQARKRAWIHVRQDGSTLEVETMLARLGGDFNRRLLIAEDVTERNRAERALREAKQRYTALVGDSYEAICLVDAEGRILYLSPRCTGCSAMTTRSSSAATGSPLSIARTSRASKSCAATSWPAPAPP